MAGRKTKLTKELIQNAAKLLKAGNYIETVCEYLSIGTSTWYRWMQEGEQANSGLKRELWDTVKSAEAEAEIRLVTDMQKIGERDDKWQVYAWMLERKFPTRWGRKDRVEADIQHSGKDGGPIQTESTIKLEELTYDELTVLEGILEKSQSESKPN